MNRNIGKCESNVGYKSRGRKLKCITEKLGEGEEEKTEKGVVM